MLVASIGTASCGKKVDSGSKQQHSTAESGEKKSSGEAVASNKTESSTGSTKSSTSSIISNTDSINSSSAASNTEADKEEGEKLDCANMTEDDLLKDLIDKESLTEEDVLWLDSTFKYVEFGEDLTLPYCITHKAYNKLNEKGVKYQISDKLIEEELKSEYPQLRANGLEHMFSLYGLTDENKARILELLKTEKEPAVILQAIKLLANEGKDPEVGKLLLDSAKHENPFIRQEVAYALGSRQNEGMDGAIEAQLELMKDENIEVAKKAYDNCDYMDDERIMKALKDILNDESKSELHSACMDTIISMWLDYPYHERTNEEAYKICMDYFKKRPRNENVPNWETFFELKSINEDKFAEWKKKAKYYKPKEIVDVMTEIIKDPSARSLARSSAIDVVGIHGGKKAYKALKSVVNKLKDEAAKSLQSNYKSGENDYK